MATTDYSDPTLIRTVIAADLDNDGHLEVFHNNIDSYGEIPNTVRQRDTKLQNNFSKVWID